MTKAAELAKMGEVLTNSQIGGRRNLVINGAMNVSQRSTSVTGLGDGDEGYVTLDRIRHTAAASAGRFTSAQTAITDLSGFLNCLHLDCTTADTSISSGELLKLEYRMEGQDVQQLKKGTADAEKVTVSFYMKTNKAFTFMCELDDRDNNRVNTQQFTTSTSFTRHVLTFAGDTTGALDDDNAASFAVGIYLHAGSDFTGGTYSANTWQSRASSDNMRAVGIGSFYDSTDNDVKITGLQVEVGEQATPFEHRSFGEELELCKRYFQKTGNVSGNAYTPLTPYFDAATTSVGYCPIPLRPKMRLASAIAVSHSGVGELGLSIGTGTSAVSAVALQAAQSGEDFITIKFTSSDTLTQYRPMRVYANNDATAFIAFDAEL